MAGERMIHEGWRRLTPGSRDREDSRAKEPAPSDRSAATGTFICSGAIFEGRLSLKGDFHIDTEYRGSLETDGRISIGPNGSVVGNIRAREVVIQGAVVGDVHAPRQLVLESTGRLHGDIETACLEIEKHAFFKGATTMHEPQASRRSAAAPAPPATSPQPLPA